MSGVFFRVDTVQYIGTVKPQLANIMHRYKSAPKARQSIGPAA